MDSSVVTVERLEDLFFCLFRNGLSIIYDINRKSLAILRFEPDDDLASCVFNSVREEVAKYLCASLFIDKGVE